MQYCNRFKYRICSLKDYGMPYNLYNMQELVYVVSRKLLCTYDLLVQFPNKITLLAFSAVHIFT
jgi:hypothetical protein